MNRYLLSALLFIAPTLPLLAQNTFPSTGSAGIGTTAPATSAILEVKSTTKGVLLPRMTAAQKNAIASPASGLLIYLTDSIKGFYYYDAGWKAVTPTAATFLNKNLSNLTAPTAVSADLLPGTTNARNLGSATLGWKDMYLAGFAYLDGKLFMHNKTTYSTYVGNSAGSKDSGSRNTGIGHESLLRNTTGHRNTAVGAHSLEQNTTGYYNTANGYLALVRNTTGYSNSAFGAYAMDLNATGIQNVAIGDYALRSNTTSSGNTAIGSRALTSNTAANNTAVGANVLASNTIGGFNAAIGASALLANTEGNYNTASGYQALNANTIGSQNVANGAVSLSNNTTGNYNTAVGNGSLHRNVSGNSNTAIGHLTLANNYIGEGNTASGISALENNIGGENNTANGRLALWSNGDGTDNTAVGAYANWTAETNSFTTTLGSLSAVSGNNATAIGYGSTATASNQVRLGNTAVTSIGGQVGWTNFSDGRYKKDLSENVPGLSFITKLKPVTYHLKVEEIDNAIKASRPQPKKDGSGAIENIKKGLSPEEVQARAEKEKVLYTGFVAQDVEKAAEELGYDFSGVDKPKGEKDFYGLRYSEFVVPLVKATQELGAKHEELEKENKQLREENKAILERLNKLEALLTKSASITPLSLSSARLEANAPNPFNGTTIIRYHVPQEAYAARLVISDMKGAVVKAANLNKGNGQVSINSNALAAGTYTYTLWINDKKTESKKMVVTR